MGQDNGMFKQVGLVVVKWDMPIRILYVPSVATLLWPSVGVKPNTSKVGDLESSGTPECLGFDSKA